MWENKREKEEKERVEEACKVIPHLTHQLQQREGYSNGKVTKSDLEERKLEK